MRRALWCVVIGMLMASAPSIGQFSAPRLLVVIVVDQMRAEYLSVFERHWTTGFRRLLDRGALFANAAYPFARTETCPGHATVATGAFPRTHGIVSNIWWDPVRGQEVDCSIDTTEAGAHVSYGAPARSGNSGHFFEVPTFAEELVRQRPGSRIVVLTMKPDAAVGLAGRAAGVVTWFDNEAESFVTSRAYAATPDRAIAEFLASNPLADEWSRTWTLLKPPDSYVNADASLGQRPHAGRDGLFPHEIAGPNGRPDARSAGLWRQSPLSDGYIGRMAAAMVDRMQLGRDDAPDLLAVALPALDYIGHAFGPESRELEDVLARLDGTIGELLGELDAKVGRERYVLALTADHGVVQIPYGRRGGRIVVEDVQDRVEELLRRKWGVADRNRVAVRGSSVYFASGVFARVRGDKPLWQSVLNAISEFPGVARVLVGDDLSAASADPIVRAVALGYVPGRSGDLIIVSERGWLVIGRNSANATSHGSPHDYDRRVPLILFGGGIRAGRFDREATPADIAPTLADMVGIRLPSAEGRVLREAIAW